MIEIKKLSKKDYNWAIFRDGRHVGAIVEAQKEWFLWHRHEEFNDAEMAVINSWIKSLNDSQATH